MPPTCIFCGKRFEDEEKKKEHETVDCPLSKCAQCGAKMQSVKELATHLATHDM